MLMPDHGMVRKTIKVTIHLDGAGRAAIGVVESEWRGALRIDRRLAAARPLPRDVPAATRGVPESLWLAWYALDARLRAWETDEGWRQR